MIVNKHYFVNEHCVFCGAETWPRVQKRYSDLGQSVPQNDERTCVNRDDYVDQRFVRPEPKRREYAYEDFDTIRERLAAILAERKPIEATPEAPANAADGCYF